MTAKTGSKELLLQKGYIFEPKLDGFRAICTVGKNIFLTSRNGNDLTKTFPEIKPKVNAIRCTLDGELVIYNPKGLPEFQLMQKREEQKSKAAANYIVFDLLEKNGKSLMDKPLMERKKELKRTLVENSRVQLVPFTTDGEKLWKEVSRIGFEGVIAKEASSKYYPGTRTNSWMKIKNLKTTDAIIVGFTEEKRSISSLALAAYDRGNLKYIGKVGTGFSEQTIMMLRKLLKEKNKPTVDTDTRGIKWVKPALVCEVRFLEMTRDGLLRAPVFLRLRKDKKPNECLISEVKNEAKIPM